MSILDKAKKIVYEDRALDYEPPRISHARTAVLWSAYLGKELTPKDVCLMMILLKVGREQGKHKEDSLVDIAGYAENITLL